MTFIKKNWGKFVVIIFLVVTPVFTLYADSGGTVVDGNTGGGKILNPIKVNSISELIKTILEGALKIGIPIIALAIIYCGFLFVAARGKPEAITKAKDALLYTLIGAAILLGSWAIAELIGATVKGLS